MAKRKAEDDAEEESPAKARRQCGFWAVFNAWWREHYDRTGRRPTVKMMTEWYKGNAKVVWGDDPPSLEELKQLSKGLRSTKSVREYFKKYRAAKRQAKDGESPVRRARPRRVAKGAASRAKPRRGRRAGPETSDEEEDPDYGVEFETEDMEDEWLQDLAGEDQAAAGAGEQQPQQPQQPAGFLPLLLDISTTAQPAPQVPAATAFFAAASAAAAKARAAHAAAAGLGSQAAYSGGAQEAEHEHLCYTPRPEMEDAGASLAQRGSWQHSAQHAAAATTALDPAGSGFSQPPAAHTASRAPSPPASNSPPTPSYTGGAAAPVAQDHLHVSPTHNGHRSSEGAGSTSGFSAPLLLPPPQQSATTTSTAPTGPACYSDTAAPLPRYMLGGRYQTTAGSAQLPSHGSVPLPPLPGHAVQYMQLQQPAGAELPGGTSRAHSMPCAAFPPAPGSQRHTAPSGSFSEGPGAPPPGLWQNHHPPQYGHAPYPHHAPPPHGSAAAAPGPYRYGPAGYPPHPGYSHGYHPAYGGYGYPPYGMPPPPYGYPPAPYGRYTGSASAPPPPPSYAPPHHPYHHAYGMPPAHPHSAGPHYPQYPQYPQQQQQPAAATTAAPPLHSHPGGSAGALELSHSLTLARTSDGAGLSWLPSLHDDVDLDAVLEAEMGAGAGADDFLDMPNDQNQLAQPPQLKQRQSAIAPASTTFAACPQQAARPSEGGHTDAFAELWVHWDADKGEEGAPAVYKDGVPAGAQGVQQRPCVQVHVFHE